MGGTGHPFSSRRRRRPREPRDCRKCRRRSDWNLLSRPVAFKTLGRRVLGGIEVERWWTRSSSAPAPTAWWPRTSWPTTAGRSWSSRPRTSPAVRCAAIAESIPMFVNDLFSSFYPLAVASPAIRALELERFGLRWSHAPVVMAHPMTDGRCAVLQRGFTETAAGIERDFGLPRRPGLVAAQRPVVPAGPPSDRRDVHSVPARQGGSGDGAGSCAPPEVCARRASWRCRCGGWPRRSSPAPGPACCWPAAPCTRTCCPSPPAARLRLADGDARSAVRLAGAGRRGQCADRRAGAPAGIPGRHACSAACGSSRSWCATARPWACAPPTARLTRAARAVLADVAATSLYGDLVGWDELPARARADLRRFQWDFSTFKVDWALNGAIPWTAPDAALRRHRSPGART